MPGKCVYSSDWERQFKWVRDVKNNRQRAFCTTCLKEVDIGNMGVGACEIIIIFITPLSVFKVMENGVEVMEKSWKVMEFHD